MKNDKFERVQVVDKINRIYLITLPDGCTPGRWEAAKEFVLAFSELRQKEPRCSFQLTSFSHDSNGGVTAWLAVGKEG